VSHPGAQQFKRRTSPAPGQSTAACVTYHVSTDGLGHHAPDRSFGGSCRRDGWRGRWDQGRRDGGLWRRRS